jgi:hypothetical protein
MGTDPAKKLRKPANEEGSSNLMDAGAKVFLLEHLDR